MTGSSEQRFSLQESSWDKGSHIKSFSFVAGCGRPGHEREDRDGRQLRTSLQCPGRLWGPPAGAGGAAGQLFCGCVLITLLDLFPCKIGFTVHYCRMIRVVGHRFSPDWLERCVIVFCRRTSRTRATWTPTWRAQPPLRITWPTATACCVPCTAVPTLLRSNTRPHTSSQCALS